MKRVLVDVAVVGGGIAGMCAAVAAARNGMKVALVNDRSVLGGNASSEIGVAVSGASHLGLNPSVYAKEGGLIEELRMRMVRYSEGGGYGTGALGDAVFFDWIYEEENIRLLLNTSVFGCETRAGEIVKCFARHSVSNEVVEIEGKMFIDASGNGVLAKEAGCSYRMGREGKEEYWEKWAPEKGDDFTMGNTIYFETYDCGHDVSYTPPKFAYKVGEMDFIKRMDDPGKHRSISVKGAHWSFEYGGQTDVIYHSEDVDLELRRLIFGIWDYVKNSGKYPEAGSYVLKRIYTRAGARESRRFWGDYTLTENDIEEKRDYEDAVCIGGWPMDIHAPLGIYDEGPATNFVPVTGIYNIPLRCLYTKDRKNLFLAGRNISASHIALGSTRVMATCGVIGQAVGTAAAYCVKEGILPGRITERASFNHVDCSDSQHQAVCLHINRLQALLTEQDQTILGRECLSPAMAYFKASASCEKAYENVSQSGWAKLEQDFGIALALETPYLESAEFYIANRSGEERILHYRILKGKHKETYLPETTAAVREIVVPGKYCGWLVLPIRERKGEDDRLYVIFAPDEFLAVGTGKERPVGAVTLRMYGPHNSTECNHDSVPLDKDTGFLYMEHRYDRERNVLFRSLVPAQHLYSPSQVLNPYTRPYGTPNLWLGEGEYPWTLTLVSERPVDAKGVAVIFDTCLESETLKTLPGCLARDYDISVTCAQGVMVYEVRDNWKRYAVTDVEAAGITKIEITVLRSFGGSAGIYGVNLL